MCAILPSSHLCLTHARPIGLRVLDDEISPACVLQASMCDHRVSAPRITTDHAAVSVLDRTALRYHPRPAVKAAYMLPTQLVGHASRGLTPRVSQTPSITVLHLGHPTSSAQMGTFAVAHRYLPWGVLIKVEARGQRYINGSSTNHGYQRPSIRTFRYGRDSP